MGLTYKAVAWNRQKKYYDRWLLILVLLLLATYFGASLIVHPTATLETTIIRSTAFVAIALLHIILCIGPLCRMDDRFLPLLYNRRHLGVTMFLLAAIHGIFSLIQFHSLGDVPILVSLFTSNESYVVIREFPFQVLGFFSLCILFLMAVTSHDFWMYNLSPSIWKGLHMSVYLAYILLLGHVALGTLQYETSFIYPMVLGGGFLIVCGLHTYTGWREVRRIKSQTKTEATDGFFLVGKSEDIPEYGAISCNVQGQHMAIYRYDGKIVAVNSVCRHQLGPLAEGRIIDGCITCPWHGYQYLPENGNSPPPFTEQIETYSTRILEGNIWVNPVPNPLGSETPPSHIPNSRPQ